MSQANGCKGLQLVAEIITLDNSGLRARVTTTVVTAKVRNLIHGLPPRSRYPGGYNSNEVSVPVIWANIGYSILVFPAFCFRSGHGQRYAQCRDAQRFDVRAIELPSLRTSPRQQPGQRVEWWQRRKRRVRWVRRQRRWVRQRRRVRWQRWWVRRQRWQRRWVQLQPGQRRRKMRGRS
jgi:hypothetical protein